VIEAHKCAYVEYDTAATADDVPSTQEQRDWPGVCLEHTEPFSFVFNSRRSEIPSEPVYLS
jgi:hypothetical protein